MGAHSGVSAFGLKWAVIWTCLGLPRPQALSEEPMSEVTTLLQGGFRSPRNMHAEAAGSIHNDAVASKLGFKGGTVPGSIHMDQFAPLLVQVFGETWFEKGNLSLYFTQATVDNEAVRCALAADAGRARLSMFNEAGDLICEGTASLSIPDEESELARRMRMQEPVGEGRLRILGDVRVGDEHRDLAVRISREGLERGLETITEELTCYRADNVLPASQIVHLAHMTRPKVMEKQKPAVGLFGALEVRELGGPLKAETDYLARTRILKLTESPRTENAWYDVTFQDAATGGDVGAVLYCLRFMKGSSPLWAA
jgi:hypothetical protein